MKSDKDKDIDIEIKTVGKMIEIYCRDHHDGNTDLCEECRELLEYAKKKLKKCPHEIKPKCSDCKIHCYETVKRNRIREVMKYSGRRMLLKHPILTIKHFKK